MLKKATYESGFKQSFEYDRHGNLISVTSEGGGPNIMCQYVTTSCTVEYASVICKKNEQPLNFIVLPGIDKAGLYNQALSIRYITLANIGDYPTPFNQDFRGKFWWDEENIINNHVEVARARRDALE